MCVCVCVCTTGDKPLNLEICDICELSNRIPDNILTF